MQSNSIGDRWRSQLEKDNGKRPRVKLIERRGRQLEFDSYDSRLTQRLDCRRWYDENAENAWQRHTKGCPSFEEVKAHAKCLRSVDQVRSYFQRYRATKKPGNEGAAEAEAHHEEEGDGPKARCLPVESKVKMSKMKIWSTAQGPPPPGHEQAAAKRKLEEQEMMMRKVKRRGESSMDPEALTSDYLTLCPDNEIDAFEPEAFLGALNQIIKNMNEKASSSLKTQAVGQEGQALCQWQLPTTSAAAAPSNIVSSEAPTQLMPAPLPPSFPYPLCSPIVGGKVEGLETLFASPMPPPPLLPYQLGPCPLSHHIHPLSCLPPSTLKQQHQFISPQDPPPFEWSPATIIPPPGPLNHLSHQPQVPIHASMVTSYTRPATSSGASASRQGSFFPIIPCPPGSCTKKYLSQMRLGLGAMGLPPPPSPLGSSVDQGLQLDEELIKMLEGTPTRHQMAPPPPCLPLFQPSSAGGQRALVPPLVQASAQPLDVSEAKNKPSTPLDRQALDRQALDRQALSTLFGSSPL